MFLRKCLGIFMVLAVVTTAGVSRLASAQELQALPELDKSFNLAGYAAMTDTVTKEFPNISDAGFAVALPRTWLERMSLGQDYGEIARFDGPALGDIRPYFSYRRQAVAKEITARLELINYILKRGYVLRAIREIDDRNVEATYVVLDDRGDSFLVRALMRVMGPYMLLAEYALPVGVWADLKDTQTFAIRSFKFLKNSEQTIEKRTERVYFSSLKFLYPASWVFEGESVPADNRVTVQIASRSENGLEAGRIALGVAGPRSLKDAVDRHVYDVDVPALLKEVRKIYEDKGFDLGSAIETRKPDLNLPTDFSVMNVYNLRRKLTNYETDRKAAVSQELWIAVFRSPGPETKTYIATLFTPSRTEDLYQWAVNTRAFEIVLKSIQ